MNTFAIVLTFAVCSAVPPSASYADDAKVRLKIPKTTAMQRLLYVRKARVWEATDVSAKDLYNGPSGRLAFAVDEEVSGWDNGFYGYGNPLHVQSHT